MIKTYTDYSGATYTENGTRVYNAGEQTLGKDAFLLILAAELTNQDPTSDVDSTQYISQLAQFTSLEQMSNLNSTMTESANRDLVGKGVTVSNKDSSGNNYSGVVAAVTKQGSNFYITMMVNDNGKNVYMDFPIKNVLSVVDPGDNSTILNSSINSNLQYMFASSLINQNVEITDVDSDGKELDPVKGIVTGAYKSKGIVYVTVQLESGEKKSYSYDKISKVGNCEETSKDTEDKTEKTK